MGALREALDRALGGRGRLVVVSGDAGIGKSTVASALAALAEKEGAAVTWGRAWEYADAPPYFPVRGALRSLGIDPLAEVFRREGGSFGLWEAVAIAVAEAAAKRPLVWILEDLHAADILTLDLLTFLAQAVRGVRALVLVTTRVVGARLDERASQRLTRMARDGVDVRLAPLTSEQVKAVAERICGSVSREVATRLAELTGGTPLFVVECARALEASGSLDALPPTVRHVVLDRFQELPEETRRALAHGAVLGRELTAARVAKMEGTLPARIIDALHPALRAGLLTELEPGRFVFRHVIVRDVIEETLGAEEKARAHARAEAALAAAPANDASDVLVERARHALGAASAGDVERAVELARRAIERLESEGAHDRAHALSTRVVAATDAMDAACLSTADLLRFAEVAHAAGRQDACMRLCDRVLARSRAEGDAQMFARATLLTGAILRPAMVDGSLVARLEEARRRLGEESPALARRLEARHAAALQPAIDPKVPIQMARDVIARARELDDETFLDVLDTATAALVDYAPIPERLAAYEEIATRARVRSDRPRLLRAQARLALDQALVGDFAAFDAAVDAAVSLAEEMGHPRFRWKTLLLVSMRAIARGDLATSERALVEVEELATLTDDPALASALVAHRVARAGVTHDDKACRESIAPLVRWETSRFASLMACAYRAGVYARMEDEAACAAELVREAEMFALAEPEPAFLGVVESVAFAASEPSRRRLRELLDPFAHLHHCGGHVSVSYDGPVSRSLALLDASLGDTDGALRRLATARRTTEDAGLRSWVARIDYDLARVARAAGRKDALEHAQRAETLAADLGLDGLAAKVRRFMGGEDVVVRAAPSPRRTLVLTKEGDMWRLDHGTRTTRVRDSRGMMLLARLVERADEEVHVLALASDAGGGGLAETSAGDVLDERAKRAYRERVRDLATEVDEAEQASDRGRLERLRAEKEALEEELARAVGLGGRGRKQGSLTERARVNVQRRLKDAIAKVTEADPELGRFLERAIRTGTFCCYRP